MEAVFSWFLNKTLENKIPLVLLALRPGHHPALWPSTPFGTLPSQGPLFPQGCYPITDHHTQFGLSSLFLHVNVELLGPRRYISICCHSLFWGFSLGMTLVSLKRQPDSSQVCPFSAASSGRVEGLDQHKND